MAERYTRRENTNWWGVQLNRNTRRGEELSAENDFPQFEDLLDYRKRIEDWLERAASDIRRIYEDRELAAEYCPPLPEIDLEEVSWLDAIKLFKSSISERIERLRRLISDTD
jgi:hypothetical protein